MGSGNGVYVCWWAGSILPRDSGETAGGPCRRRSQHGIGLRIGAADLQPIHTMQAAGAGTEAARRCKLQPQPSGLQGPAGCSCRPQACGDPADCRAAVCLPLIASYGKLGPLGTYQTLIADHGPILWSS